jgi:hypothetical protein
MISQLFRSLRKFGYVGDNTSFGIAEKPVINSWYL